MNSIISQHFIIKIFQHTAKLQDFYSEHLYPYHPDYREHFNDLLYQTIFLFNTGITEKLQAERQPSEDQLLQKIGQGNPSDIFVRNDQISLLFKVRSTPTFSVRF